MSSSNSRSSEEERRGREGNQRRGVANANENATSNRGHSLLVRNFPKDTREVHLRHAVRRFGQITDVYMPRDYYTGKLRGFAFIEFLEAESASEAQSYMNHQIFHGDYITVLHSNSTRASRAELRSNARTRYGSNRSNHGSQSQSRSYSRSRSPRYRDSHSRSRRRENYLSPCYSRSPDKRSLERLPPRGSRSRSADSSADRKK